MKAVVKVHAEIAPVNVPVKGRRSALLLGSLGLLALALVGCGNAKFDKQEFKATASAGQYTKPKIDIVVFQDNSSSMIQPMANVKSQFHNFVEKLDANWDYHFTVLPLQSAMSFSSKYILASDCSGISSCIPSSNKDAFNNTTSTSAGWINQWDYGTNSTDLAFKYMTSNLSHSSVTSTGFLRPDAALAVVIISNGEDLTALSGSSYVAANSLSGFYVDPDGDGTPEVNYALPAYVNAATNFENFLNAYKGTSSLKRVFSVVAANNSNNCQGSGAWQGRRYMDLAASTNGYWYDFCNASALNNVLSSISYDMSAMMEAFVFDYVVLDAAPVVSSIKIYKNGVAIPQGGPNGWSYVGYSNNQPTAFYPSLSNNRTGYFIKLSGTANYKGSDVISIDYQKQ